MFGVMHRVENNNNNKNNGINALHAFHSHKFMVLACMLRNIRWIIVFAWQHFQMCEFGSTEMAWLSCKRNPTQCKRHWQHLTVLRVLCIKTSAEWNDMCWKIDNFVRFISNLSIFIKWVSFSFNFEFENFIGRMTVNEIKSQFQLFTAWLLFFIHFCYRDCIRSIALWLD